MKEHIQSIIKNTIWITISIILIFIISIDIRLLIAQMGIRKEYVENTSQKILNNTPIQKQIPEQYCPKNNKRKRKRCIIRNTQKEIIYERKDIIQ